MTMLPSDPLYAEWNALLMRRCEVINAHMAWDTRWICELPDAERNALLTVLDDAVQETFKELSR